MAVVNKKFCLKQRPYGKPDQNTWDFCEEKIETVNDGDFLVEVEFISLDPAMRGWLDDRRSYIPPVAVGEVMRAGTIGKVIKSRNDKFREGDYVVGWHGVQTYAISNGNQDFNLGKSLAVSPEKFLGVLGMPGFTAYFGLFDVGKVKKGQTLVVSAAAGAVGSVVGQLGKIKDMKVIGIAGGPDKCKYVTEELGFDACIDYKHQDFAKNFVEASSSGIDIYFDNVGGELLDFALTRLNKNARVVICGAISQYNNTGRVYGPSNYLSLLVNSASMEGFVILDYQDRYPEASNYLAQWLMSGQIKTREDVVEGIENFPSAFDKLFSGDKMGKLVLKVLHD